MTEAQSKRILIVEDELLVALMVEEFIREFGYIVSGIANTLAAARLEFAKRNFDAVLLDINLDNQYHPEMADLLLKVSTPFAFVTGYDYVLDPRYERVPILCKPFSPADLRILLEKLVGPNPLFGGSNHPNMSAYGT
jgi:DNA-binding response OmpR family regulator